MIQETTIVDSDGWSWTARQMIGASETDTRAGSPIEFVKAQTGETLLAHVEDATAVGIEELELVLAEARRAAP